ncbi:hypothetical protein [Paraburkholderia tropica]|uniref:hypothetical protein n=1 Tax=Paraburkholderia tropica TaxID=92647 RepID=UPI002AB6DB39|nr:hypothetical protein [Paraburkholderia tropica]
MPSKRELAIRAKWMQHEFEVTCTQDEHAALCERLKALLGLKHQPVRLLLHGDGRECYTSLIASFGSAGNDVADVRAIRITLGPGVRHLLGAELPPAALIDAAERLAREHFWDGRAGTIRFEI